MTGGAGTAVVRGVSRDTTGHLLRADPLQQLRSKDRQMERNEGERGRMEGMEENGGNPGEDAER